jgi:hypothetical protein
MFAGAHSQRLKDADNRRANLAGERREKARRLNRIGGHARQAEQFTDLRVHRLRDPNQRA